MVGKTQAATATVQNVTARETQQADDHAVQKKKDLESAQQAQIQTTKSREAQGGLVNVVG